VKNIAIEQKTKSVGNRKPPETAAEFLAIAQRMNAEMALLIQEKRPRGFVMKFKTHDDYHKWKSEQTNPWLR
jgi:hypothetical protein